MLFLKQTLTQEATVYIYTWAGREYIYFSVYSWIATTRSTLFLFWWTASNKCPSGLSWLKSSCKSSKYQWLLLLPSCKGEMGRGTRREISRTVLWACSYKKNTRWNKHLKGQLQKRRIAAVDCEMCKSTVYSTSRLNWMNKGHILVIP